MKLDLSKKNHIDCFKLMTGNHDKGTFVREKCPKCGNMKNQATGRKIYCRRSTNTIEIRCNKCWYVYWIGSPDWVS